MHHPDGGVQIVRTNHAQDLDLVDEHIHRAETIGEVIEKEPDSDHEDDEEGEDLKERGGREEGQRQRNQSMPEPQTMIPDS